MDQNKSEGRYTPDRHSKTKTPMSNDKSQYTDNDRSGTNMSGESNALKFEAKDMEVSYDLKASHLQMPRMYTMV